MACLSTNPELVSSAARLFYIHDIMVLRNIGQVSWISKLEEELLDPDFTW